MKSLIIILSLFSSLVAFAQDDLPGSGDSIIYSHIDKKNNSYRRNVRTRYGLIDFGISSLSSPTTYRLENGIDPFELRLIKSTNFNLHLIQQRVSLVDRSINFNYGLALESHRYFFDNRVVLLDDTPEVLFEFVEEARFKKNRLTYTYLTVPFMLNLKSDPRHPYRSLHVSVGGFGGLLLGANFKTKESGDKEKVRDNFGLNSFRYGLRGEFGYGPIILYGTWTLNKLFDKDKDNGYELTPFAIGLVIWPF